MVRRISLLAAIFMLAFAGANFAGDINAESSAFDIRYDVREMDRTDKMSQELSHEVDLWHDAILKRNAKRVRKHQKRIFSLIDSDIRARSQAVRRYEREASKSVSNIVENVRADEPVSASEKYAAKDDIKDLRKARQLVKAKEILFDSIKRTETFSNRYRLLGDYLEIVHRENRLNKIELAESIPQDN